MDISASPASDPLGKRSGLWFRILLESGAIGPGKIALLEAIAALGSISAAARALDMSYRRAWGLADSLNKAFAEPLVDAERGGDRRGGARLTVAGRRVLDVYRGLQAEMDAAARPWLATLPARAGAAA